MDVYLFTSAQVTAGATVVVAIFTAGLFAGAVFAGVRLGQELELTRALRSDSLLPWLVISKDVDDDPSADELVIALSNAGPGIALEVKISLWVFPRQVARNRDSTIETIHLQHGRRPNWGEPHFTTGIPAIGGNAVDVILSADPLRPLDDVWIAELGYLVGYELDYLDASEARPRGIPRIGGISS